MTDNTRQMNDTMRDRNNMDRNGMDENRNNMPMVRNGGMSTYPETYRDDYRDIYRGYRRDRMNKNANVFRNERNYRQYDDEAEIFETLIKHMTKAVKFHDRMMDLYGFLGLYGFKKMHEYQYLMESMERRQLKCYALDHLGILTKDDCDEKGIEFIPDNWYTYDKQDISADVRKQYIKPSLEGYKQWENETKDLLSYCSNELMYLGRMADFNEVIDLLEDVEEEIQGIDKLMVKLESVNFNMEFIMKLQDELCEKYDTKMENLFMEKLEEDKIKKRHHKENFTIESHNQRRNSRTGRYMR